MATRELGISRLVRVARLAAVCGFLVALTALPAFAQAPQPGEDDPNLNPTPWCFFDELLRQRLLANPGLAETLRQQERIIQKFIESSGTTAGPGSMHTIPVVVYIVSSSGLSPGNIPDSAVTGQLEALNLVFNPLGIRFCLATQDPPNSPFPGPTRGIFRIFNPGLANHTTGATINTFVYPNEQLALKSVLPPLDPAKYMRIWVVEDIDDPPPNTPYGILGYASLPDYFFVSNLDGIVMRYDVFCAGGSCFPETPGGYGQGDTLAHEVGHYLNLWHTFEYSCSGFNPYYGGQGDCVSDTPPVLANHPQGCPSGPVNTCVGAGSDLKDNQMDYYNDICRSGFTNEQRLRMDATLTQLRSTLIDGGNLQHTGVNVACAGGTYVNTSASPQKACVLETVFFQAAASPTLDTFDWDFGDNSPLGTGNVPFHYYAFEDVYTVTVTATNSNNPNDPNEIATDTITVYVNECMPILSPQGHWYFGDKAGLNFWFIRDFRDEFRLLKRHV